jgi:hypothetical protein
MHSPGNASHPVAQVTAVHPEFLDYDRPKVPSHYCDKTHTSGHCKCHYPEARLARRKSPPDSLDEDVHHKDIQNTEAEDYGCIHNDVSIAAVPTHSGDVDAVMLCDTGEECLHTRFTPLAPLR